MYINFQQNWIKKKLFAKIVSGVYLQLTNSNFEQNVREARLRVILFRARI